jgi:CRP/FNR family transcriptional regulator, cyclic AMP receptor protein
MTAELLDVLGAFERDAVQNHLMPRRYRPGEVVFNEGVIGDCLHIVVAGRLIVEATTPAGVTVALRVVHPGEFFGELALVREGHRRTARVVALEVTDTATLHRNDFEQLRLEHPSVDRLLVAALAERVVITSDLVVEMLMPADERVWRRLAVLVEAYGGNEVRMTQDHLAQAAGAARQTVNRVLREGQRDGVIALTRGAIRVLDHAALDRRAEGIVRNGQQH